MPSPFPGMDPYLEHPAFFPGLHDRLVTYLGEALQAKLPAPYYAEIGDRLWVEVSQRVIGPDVNILRPRPSPTSRRGESESHGGVALAEEVTARPVVVTVPHDEFREPFLQILSRQNEERVVATVEVLSPANKTLGSQGRELYLRKQREVLDSQTHLVEIDLLRGGEHTTAVPRDLAVAKAGPFEYHVCVHRFDKFEDYSVYAIRLSQRLPEVAIPLLPGDPAVTIDLQTVFDRCYDTGPYQRRIRYHESTPVPQLPSEFSEWSANLLRSRT